MNSNFLALTFNELMLNQFKTIEMSCSKHFSTTENVVLDLYKVLLSENLPVFPKNTMKLLKRILNMRGPRIEP